MVTVRELFATGTGSNMALVYFFVIQDAGFVLNLEFHSGFRIRIHSGFRILNFISGFRILNFIQDPGWGSWLRILNFIQYPEFYSGSWGIQAWISFRIQDPKIQSGFRIHDAGCRIQKPGSFPKDSGFRRWRSASSSLLGLVVPSFRALPGGLNATFQVHNFNENSLSRSYGVLELYGTASFINSECQARPLYASLPPWDCHRSLGMILL